MANSVPDFQSEPNSWVREGSKARPWPPPQVTLAWPLPSVTFFPPAPCSLLLFQAPPAPPKFPCSLGHRPPRVSLLLSAGGRAGSGDSPTYAWIQRHFAEKRDLQVLAHDLRTPSRWREYLRLLLGGKLKGEES